MYFQLLQEAAIELLRSMRETYYCIKVQLCLVYPELVCVQSWVIMCEYECVLGFKGECECVFARWKVFNISVASSKVVKLVL